MSVASPTLPTNSTEVLQQEYTHRALVFHCIISTLALLILINNATVFLIYNRLKSLQSGKNFLLVCLSFTDFLAGAMAIPFSVAASVVSHGNSNNKALFFASSAISDLVIICNVSTLFLIFLERYLAICHPIFTRANMTKSKTKNALILSWTLSFVMALVPLTWSYEMLLPYESSKAHQKMAHLLDSYHSMFVSVFCFFLPSCFMLFFSVTLLRAVMFVSPACTLLQKRRVRCRRKAYVMLICMYVLLLITWSPLIVIRMLIYTKENLVISTEVLEVLMTIRYLTSFMNPFIYTIIKYDFRQALFDLFTCD